MADLHILPSMLKLFRPDEIAYSVSRKVVPLYVKLTTYIFFLSSQQKNLLIQAYLR